MAETVTRTKKPATEGKKAASKKAAEEPAEEKKVNQAKPVGNATGLRIGAICFWLLAIGCEVLALLFINGQLNLLPRKPQILWIPALILDLIFVIIGSMLWKKANRIKPASKKNKTLFWLWNNMGLIVSCLAFLPFVIMVLTNKNQDKKTKTIATIAGVVFLLIAGAASYDYNPISLEEKTAAETSITGNVYWTTYGKVYHAYDDCSHIKDSTAYTIGTVSEALAANRTRLCKTCAARFAAENPNVDINTLLVDESEE